MRTWQYTSFISLLVMMLFAPAIIEPKAQQARLVTPQPVTLFEGPGTSYQRHPLQLGLDQPYSIQERNMLGNWVLIDAPESPWGGGWAQTGELFLTGDRIQIQDVPLTDMPTTNPAVLPIPDIPEILFTTPVLPESINTEKLGDIYRDGQSQGNDRFSVVKVGDCNTASDQFLKPIAVSEFDTGPYTHIADTVANYSASFGRQSIAARNGFNVSSIFDPFWATSDLCDPDESPLACEYRHNPATVAFIMFGQNDVLVLSREEYRDYLSQTIEETIDRGIMPVLSTFTNDPKNEANWEQIIAMNVITIEVAAEYDIPLINFWLAARDLPSYGIGDDYAHLTAGGSSVAFTEGREAQYGLTLYNLAVLNMLDRLYHDVVQVYTYENTRSS